MAGRVRDKQGKFSAGDCGGPGRPPRAVEIDYLRVLSDACTLPEWQIICKTAIELAKKGDAKSREWISLHLLPRPDGALNLARLDAADRIGFDMAELHVSDMYRQARLAKSTGDVVANFAAAEEAGIRTKSLTELLKIGLFGVNGAADGPAGDQDDPNGQA
jgi:hypothetical protein